MLPLQWKAFAFNKQMLPLQWKALKTSLFSLTSKRIFSGNFNEQCSSIETARIEIAHRVNVKTKIEVQPSGRLYSFPSSTSSLNYRPE